MQGESFDRLVWVKKHINKDENIKGGRVDTRARESNDVGKKHTKKHEEKKTRDLSEQ